MSKTALIWGAAGDIGRALTKMLANQGWQVIGVARNTDRVDPSAAKSYEADLNNSHSVESVVVQISQEFDAIDWWIYAAGDILSSPVEEMDSTKWHQIIDANLSGVYLSAHHSIPLLSNSAPMYVLGAVSERMRLPGLSAYAAAKAGVEALGDVMRKELRRPVVIVRPKAVKTSFWERVPFSCPPSAMTTEELAQSMWNAFQEGYKQPKLDI